MKYMHCHFSTYKVRIIHSLGGEALFAAKCTDSSRIACHPDTFAILQGWEALVPGPQHGLQAIIKYVRIWWFVDFFSWAMNSNGSPSMSSTCMVFLYWIRKRKASRMNATTTFITICKERNIPEKHSPGATIDSGLIIQSQETHHDNKVKEHEEYPTPLWWDLSISFLL